jgi:hypothetical protein
MDKRELDNFLVSRGVGEPDCPICGNNEWQTSPLIVLSICS